MGNAIARLAVFVSLAGLASGCTTTLVSQGDPGGDSDLGGIPYHLPVREIVVDASWRLKSCGPSPDNRNDIVVSLVPTVKIKESLIEGEALVIDYQQLTNPFKTGKLKVTYWTIGEGKDARTTTFVKSINGEIAGQEAEAIKAGVSAVGSLVGLAARFSGLPVGGGIVGPKGLDSEPRIRCRTAMLADIASYEDTEAQLKSIALEQEDINRRIVVLNGRVVDDKLPKKDKAELAAIKLRASKLNQRHLTLVEARDKLLPLISYDESFPLSSFTQSSLDQKIADVTIVPNVKKIGPLIDKLIEIDVSNCNPKIPTCSRETQLSKIADSHSLSVQLALTRSGGTPASYSKDHRTPREVAGKNFNGFIYREPVDATISVRAARDDSKSPLAELSSSFPQFGPVRRLPLRSRFAEKNGLIANFAADGRPTDISYDAYEAGGVKAIQAVGQGLEGANGAIDLVRKAQADKQTAADEAPLKAAKNQIALIKAEDELATLRAQPSPESAARKAELERLQYEVSIAELEAKLKASKGD